MGNGFDLHLLEKRKHRLYIDFRRRKQRFAKGFSGKLGKRRADVCVFDVENFTHKGESVGMNAARRQRDYDVSFFHRLMVDNLSLINHAD